MSLDKETLLKIWFNLGLKVTIFRGAGPTLAVNDGFWPVYCCRQAEHAPSRTWWWKILPFKKDEDGVEFFSKAADKTRTSTSETLVL